jgi:hypothetical protein
MTAPWLASTRRPRSSRESASRATPTGSPPARVRSGSPASAPARSRVSKHRQGVSSRRSESEAIRSASLWLPALCGSARTAKAL